jgi:hypothetical protein
MNVIIMRRQYVFFKKKRGLCVIIKRRHGVFALEVEQKGAFSPQAVEVILLFFFPRTGNRVKGALPQAVEVIPFFFLHFFSFAQGVE